MFLRELTLCICTLIAGTALAADKPGPNDWPQWRGQNRDGKSPETGLLKSWPKDGPTQLWTAKDLGTGFGTPSVAAGKIFGIGSRSGKDGVWALNEADGKELWSTPFSDTAPVYKNTNGPSSTPTYANGKVYAVSLGGRLVCLDASSGKEIWNKEYTGEKGFGGKVPTWGYNESVLVDRDQVICTPGGAKTSIVALKADSGDVLWSTPVGAMGGGEGYSSPVKTTVGGIPMYVVLLGKQAGIVGVHADTGKLLWQYNKAALGGGAQIATPIVVGDTVWFSTAYDEKTAGAALLQLVPEGKDKIAVKEIRTYKKADLTNHHGNMVLVDGYVYLGHGQNNGIPACVDFKTGELMWKADKPPAGAGRSAAYSFADGMLYVRYENRFMTLVKPSPIEQDNKIVSSFVLPASNIAKGSGSESWPHPVIANGKLYIRDQNLMYCYNVKASTN